VDNERIESLEADLRPKDDGAEYITLNVQHMETILTPDGGRHERNIPACYDENVPFTDLGNGQRMRVRYPLEETADHGVVREKEVTGD
jgi:hypothetical protein